MSAPKHTDGPWDVALSGWGNGSSQGGEVHAMRPTGRYLKEGDAFVPETPAHGTPVCFFLTSGMPDGEGYANAQLIAAAPDGLAAAIAADLVLKAHNFDPEDSPRAELIAFIAKATGEPS